MVKSDQCQAKPIWPSVDILRLVEDFVFKNLRGFTRINFFWGASWLDSPLPRCEAASREFLFRPVATCRDADVDVGDASKGLLQSRTGSFEFI